MGEHGGGDAGFQAATGASKWLGSAQRQWEKKVGRVRVLDYCDMCCYWVVEHGERVSVVLFVCLPKWHGRAPGSRYQRPDGGCDIPEF